jgi:serine O-acetyltransferase
MGASLRSIQGEIASILERDPAARSRLEVVLCYSGLHAICGYRLTHWLWNHQFLLLARWLSQLARLLTGIEIHPAAQIGSRLFIDHGMGVVIGETSIIGDDVTLYQGATLGGTGKEKLKRHPTIGNGVVIGAGAKILGNIRVGNYSRIGAGSVVLRDVPDGATVVGVPGHIILRHGEHVIITDPKQVTDPLSSALATLATEVKHLRERVHKLEGNQSPELHTPHELQAVIEIDYQI